MPRVSITVNGEIRTAEVENRTLLVQFLRDHLRLTGTHVGCDTSQCGACGACRRRRDQILHRARGRSDGATVTTIEGLPDGDRLHPMQQAFHENHGLQCGFCTPGMIMSAIDMVRRNGNDLDEQTIRQQLEGNICRCTGYHNIVIAI